VDLVGSYRCDCKTGYSGSNCGTGDNNLRGWFVLIEIISRKKLSMRYAKRLS